MKSVQPKAEQSFALRFLEDLSQSPTRVEVTDAKGAALALREGLAQALRRMEQSGSTGNKLIFIGNGGSAAIASHQAVDFWKNGGLEAIAFNDASLLTCISNDFGYEKVFSEPFKRFARAGDTLIAISSSGRSRNILNGVEAAKGMKVHVMTFSGFEAENPLRRTGELNFYVPSHSYGIVEITHLALIHSLAEERMAKVEAEKKKA